MQIRQHQYQLTLRTMGKHLEVGSGWWTESWVCEDCSLKARWIRLAFEVSQWPGHHTEQGQMFKMAAWQKDAIINKTACSLRKSFSYVPIIYRVSLPGSVQLWIRTMMQVPLYHQQVCDVYWLKILQVNKKFAVITSFRFYIMCKKNLQGFTSVSNPY